MPSAERERHVARRVADFLGDVRRGVPARVAEHHRHQRQQRTSTGRDGARRRQMRDVAVADREAERDEQDDRRRPSTPASTFWTRRPGPSPRTWISGQHRDRGSATMPAASR